MESVASFTIQSTLATAVMLYLCMCNSGRSFVLQVNPNRGPMLTLFAAPFAIDAVSKVF